MWKIEFTNAARKEFRKLNHQSQQVISRYLDKILERDDPYSLGKPLVGELSGYWRYRVDKYRIICEIHDNKLLIEIITVAKRDKVYL